jgi:IclR family transcriptional regulator, acetate operon repressor
MTTARDRPPEEAAEDTSFARGLRILLTIADRGEIRADDLGTLLDMSMSTVYRYLKTLSEFGFVERQGTGYGLGPRLLIGTGANVSSEELIRAADPLLQMLVQETGETAIISRRIGLSAVCLHEVPSEQALRVTLGAGLAGPLDHGALARVLLAFAPPDILGEVIAQRAGSSDEAVDDERQLRDDLAEIVSVGIARTAGEYLSGTVAMAVPIMRDDGIVAAIGVIGPEARCGLAWRARVARALPDAARSIVASLGSAAAP